MSSERCCQESHKEPVYDTIWVNSKTGSEIMTCSTDGTVKGWDIRNFRRSTKTLIIDIENDDPSSCGNSGRSLGASALEYEPTIPTRSTS